MKGKIFAMLAMFVMVGMLLVPVVTAEKSEVTESNGACIITLKGSPDTIKTIYHKNGAIKSIWHQPKEGKHLVVTMIDKKGDGSFDLAITVTHDGKEHTITKELPVEQEPYSPAYEIELLGFTIIFDWYKQTCSCLYTYTLGVIGPEGNYVIISITDICHDFIFDRLDYGAKLGEHEISGTIDLPLLNR